MELHLSNPYYFSIVLVLVGLFLGLIMGGWIASKLAVTEPKVKREERESTAFLKGINYLLSDDHDQAIEEFTKAVQINSDTVETYIALGNLFRRKGELGRAIRIHKSIILRPNIDKETKIQAMYDLGLDFKKAGFIKRGISSFEEVISHDPSRLEAYIQLEELYEEIKDWENAYTIQQRISTLRNTKDNNILAHLQTEHGKAFLANNDIKSAKASFKKATSLDPNCIDALLHLGDLCLSHKDYRGAISVWKKAMKINPALTHLVYGRLERAYAEKDRSHEFGDFLKKSALGDKNNSYIHLTLAKYLYGRGEIEEAVQELRSVIKLNPAFMDARRELGRILIEHGRNDELVYEYRDLLEVLDMPEKRFRCQKCGFESESIQWKCPQCLKWDTFLPKELEPSRDITNTDSNPTTSS
ncbi:MAG: tetratricopeptide repeat protein [Pseudomonadota bacterium]